MRAFAVLAMAAVAAGVIATPAAAAPAEADIRGTGEANTIEERYIVVLKPEAVSAEASAAVAESLADRYGGDVEHSYSESLRGFTVTMGEERARRLAAHPSVRYVLQDRMVEVATTQPGAPWGLDRIDQAQRPLNGTYEYATQAANVTAYILDTGIRTTHSEFGDGVGGTRASSGWDFISGDADAQDCNGHGTHVAGTVGGTTFGVAKGVKLVGVRVLNCDGWGPYSAILAGIEWVTQNAVKPAVANMSLAGTPSEVIDQAVRNSIASGVTYALAGGNANSDACSISPARTAEAITVGASDQSDAKASFSNWGSCLDIFAPGVTIPSAGYTSDSAVTYMSGTSMASPHVAGAAALYQSTHPTATPAQVRTALLDGAVQSAVSGIANATTSRLLYTGPAGTPPVQISHPVTAPAPPVVTPAPAPCNVKYRGDNLFIRDRGSATSAVTVSGCAGRASSSTRVEVHIVHARRGDLVVELIAPNGSVKRLKTANKRVAGANLDVVYTVNMSARNRNGVWKLRVRDSYKGNTGYLDSWTLTV